MSQLIVMYIRRNSSTFRRNENFVLIFAVSLNQLQKKVMFNAIVKIYPS